MAVGLHKHTVQESINASLGQGGCIFIRQATTAGDVTPTSGDFIAITMIEDTTFDKLTPADSTIYAGNTGGAGDDIPTTVATYRKEIRTASASMETEINKMSIEDLCELYPQLKICEIGS